MACLPTLETSSTEIEMTTPLPAPAAGNRNVGVGAAALLPFAFAVFVVLHGIVHVIGFTSPWGLYTLRGVGYSTTILNGSIDVGDAVSRALGLVWLAATVAFAAVGLMLWRRHPLARRATVAVLLFSLVLCAIRLPSAVMGLGIDVVLLALLAVASDRLIRRPKG